MPNRSSQITQRDRGAVLLLLLGIIFACTLMVAAFVQSSMSEIRWAGQSRQAPKLRPHAYSALEITLASMHEYALLNEPFLTPAIDWSQAVHSEGIQFPENMDIQVQIEDISGLIGIATLTEREQWEAIFDDLEYSSFVTDPLIDALLDWMDADSNVRPFGAEAEDYRTQDLRVTPTNGPPLSIDELQHVLGFDEIWWDETGQPTAFVSQLKAMLTPLHSTPSNVNTAPLPVLKYLTGDPYSAENILNYRIGYDEIEGTEDDVTFTNQADLERNGFRLARSSAYEGQLYTIEIDIQSGGARFHLSALISLGGSATEEQASESNQDSFTIISTSEYSRFSSNQKL